MLVLGVETSTRHGSVALVDSGEVLVEHSLPDEGRRHAQTIVSEIDRILADCGQRKEDVERVGVSLGPGSFTGLRVGVVFAKTFAWLTGCELRGIRTSDVIAANSVESSPLWTLIDAQRGDVYATLYGRPDSGGERTVLTPTHVVPFADWLERLAADEVASGPILSRFGKQVQDATRLVAEEQWQPMAANVAQIAACRDVAASEDDCIQMVPFYIRKSSAEEKWDARQEC